MEINASQRSTVVRSMFRSDATQRLLAFAGLIILIIVFSLTSSNFFTFNNFVDILLATAVNAVLALGVTFVIISAGIDLSIGTVMTFAAVMTGVFITNIRPSVPVIYFQPDSNTYISLYMITWRMP